MKGGGGMGAIIIGGIPGGIIGGRIIGCMGRAGCSG